jgi:hypothetical protein
MRSTPSSVCFMRRGPVLGGPGALPCDHPSQPRFGVGDSDGEAPQGARATAEKLRPAPARFFYHRTGWSGYFQRLGPSRKLRRRLLATTNH